MKGIVEDPSAGEAESAGFGCPVNNRFGLLLDDEGQGDPFENIRAAAKAEKKKKKDEAKKDEAQNVAKPSVKKESQKDRRVPVSGGESDNSAQTKSLQGQRFPSRGGSGPAEERGERRVGFRDRRPYDNENPSLGFSIERPMEQGERGTRGRGGARGGRGMRGGGQFRSMDGFDQRGKREFERHSGSDRTGVRPEEKRGGSGQRNWGSMKDQIDDAAPAEEVADGEEGADPAEAKAIPAPEGEGEAAVEPAVEMSLDEWKALQQQGRPKAEFNLRKADTSVPSDLIIHKSKKHLESKQLKQEQAEEADGDEATALRRPANDITAKLQINFGSQGRPARGARGGRGGRGRGGPPTRTETTDPQKPPEKSRVQARVPNHDDPEDFPALA